MKTKVTRLILVVGLLIVLLFGALTFNTYSASAAAMSDFDQTDIMDDLNTATVEGQPFDANKYGYDLKGTPRILSLNEYCFSMRSASNQYYGLYVYVYNPSALDLMENSTSNKIQLATKYNSKGKPIDYESFDLKYLSKSETALQRNLYYKFKVIDKIIDGKKMIDRVTASERRYDISGITLLTKGAQNATEYSVGGSYKFSGFAQGCGVAINDPSTLTCKIEDLETVQLDVVQSVYRTDMDDSTRTHHNQLNSVYFAVPNKLIDLYGYLQKIKAEWWEYKTAPSLVTANAEAFNALKNYTTVNVGDFNTSIPYGIGIGYRHDAVHVPGVQAAYYRGGWNIYNSDTAGCLTSPKLFDGEKYNFIPWIFSTDGKNIDKYNVSEKRIYDYALDYSSRNPSSNTLPIKDGKLNAQLFSDSIDSGRTRGYNVKEFDAGERFSITSPTADSLNWWQGIKSLFGWKPDNKTYADIEPIHIVTDEDMKKPNLSEELLLNANDVDAFKDYYNKAKSEDKTTFIFRTSSTDYWADLANVYKYGTRGGILNTYPATLIADQQSFVATQTMLFDYKILTLTFNKDGDYTVIAAVASPIDIFGGLDAPAIDKSFDWLKLILAVVILIIVLVVFFPILPLIFRAIVWVVCLPFRLIGKLFHLIKGGKK